MLHIEIAGELDGGEPFRGIHEQADRAQQIDERELPGREDRSRRHAELPVASGAFETPPGRQIVNIDAAAYGASI